MRRSSNIFLIFAAALIAGGAGLSVGRSNLPLPRWLSAVLPAADPGAVQPAPTGPIIYYRDPDGAPKCSPAPAKTASGKEYLAVRSSQEVSFEKAPPVAMPGGGTVPLGEVAAIKLTRGPTSIRTENGQLAVYIFVDIRDRDLGGYVAIKSFRKKDGGDDDRQGPGRNAERNFHREKRSNETHQSTTDPEAKLYKKGDGQPAKLCYMGHALMENRHGLAVGGGVSQATGTAERDKALELIDDYRGDSERRITLGADKAYDVTPFVHELRGRSVTPHIAIDGHLTKTGKRRKTAVDAAPRVMSAMRSASVAANGSRRYLAGSRVPPVWPRLSCEAATGWTPPSRWPWRLTI